MGSSRLPGKVLKDIVGKPMLWHIVNRLSYSKLINQAVIATTTKDRDRPIIEMAKENNIPYYAGSEEDLVDRFYQAAMLFKAAAVVRITADCPLAEPRLVDKLIEFFLKNSNNYDYVSNSRPQPTYPHGLDVEIFSFSLLEKLWKEIKDPFRREWFTNVIFENPKAYRTFCLKNDVDLSHIRLTVDNKEDLELVRYIYQNLYSDSACFFLEDILRLKSKNPEIFDINKKYKRNGQFIKEFRKGD